MNVNGTTISIKKMYRVATYILLTVFAYFTSTILLSFLNQDSVTTIQIPTVHGDTSHACTPIQTNGDDAGSSDDDGGSCI